MNGEPRVSHRSAVVLVPPEELWTPIQAIRQIHDKKFRRWMPHINLLYPFVYEEDLPAAIPTLETVCGKLAPFRIRLARFQCFSESRTVWLDPEPRQAVVDLQRALQEAFPACDEVSRFPGGFTPHLSVGQAFDPPLLRDRLQASWQPIEFQVSQVCLIRRRVPPNDIFQVERRFPLSAGPKPSSAPAT